ncbi:MAG: aryl-sulfate sulfotransferase [Gemmatimonadota bacterium]
MFDNGFDRPGAAFSRAIEYAIDPVARTATKVWEYRPSPDIYAALVGSARRLSNGNTVATRFATNRARSRSHGPRCGATSRHSREVRC